MKKVKLSTNARSVKLLQYELRKVADTTELIFMPPLGKCVTKHNRTYYKTEYGDKTVRLR